jgi:GTPase SAR1 family protein
MNVNPTGARLPSQLKTLATHLEVESRSMVELLPTFSKLDKILMGLGLLAGNDSLTTRVPWWPLISVLGTYSSGKSTFINDYLGESLQATGNQAVDEMFTVICYGMADHARVLPGMALDADPRFPFYRMSEKIEDVAAGEGKLIGSFLHLKTCGNEKIKGKILVDSPGFDADDQRRSTLRVTDHIIDLSDLVLVMFDARHPEPGTMQDTLKHLVEDTVNRPDSSKFLYILNQIDTTAREDNPEDVVSAWQRGVAGAGLTAGRFYTIFSESAANSIENGAIKERLTIKRDKDLAEIYGRIEDVEIERDYRIVGVLEATANEVEREIIPALQAALGRWRRTVMFGDAIVFAVLAGLGVLLARTADVSAESLLGWLNDPVTLGFSAIGIGVVFLAGHFWVRALAATMVARKLPTEIGQFGLNLKAAFEKNTRFFRNVFRSNPVGWGKRARNRLQDIRAEAATQFQRLNDRFTDPAGRARAEAELAAAEAQAAVPAPTETTPADTKPAEDKTTAA